MLMRIIRRCGTLLASTLRGWQKDNCLLLSAATAYYAVFSLFPLCMVLIAALGFVGRFSTFAETQQHDLVARVSANFSPWMAEQLQSILAGVENRASVGGPLGLLVLILAAIGIFMQLDVIFDRIWAVPAPTRTGLLSVIRTALWDRLSAFLTLLLIGGLLIAVSLTDIILAAVRPYLAQLPARHLTWQSLQMLTSISCNALLLAVIYRVLPSAPVRWHHALAGGLLSAIIWWIGRNALLAFLVGPSYSAYGVVGAVMGVMLWFYYASAVIFLGAEFVHALGQPEKP